MDRGAWWAAVHGIAKSPTQLSRHTHPEWQTLFSRQSDELARCGLRLSESEQKVKGLFSMWRPPGVRPFPWPGWLYVVDTVNMIET